MLRLWRNIRDKSSEYDAKVRWTQAAGVNIPLPRPGTGASLIRLNALPLLSLPRHCQALTFRKPKDWQDLRSATHNTEGNLILTKSDTVWCWGSKELVRDEFAQLTGNEAFDLTAKLADLDANTHLKAFLEEALARALAKGRPLVARTQRSGSFLIADRHADDLALLEPVRAVVGTPFWRHCRAFCAGDRGPSRPPEDRVGRSRAGVHRDPG
jgi:hypothetical protein